MSTPPTYPEPLTPRVISRTCVIVYLVLYVVSCFSCLPAGFYVVLGLAMLVPVIKGPRLYRVLGLMLMLLGFYTAHCVHLQEQRSSELINELRSRAPATNTQGAAP